MSEASHSGGRAEMEKSPLSSLGKLTAAALVAFALCFIYLQAVIAQAFIPPLAVFALVSLALAGVAAWGWRWAPLVGAAWFVLVFLFSLDSIIADLSSPAALHPFLWQIVTLAVAITGAAAGIGATMQDHRHRETA